MIPLRDIHLVDGSSFGYVSYVERLDYGQLEVSDLFGIDNFAFLTDNSDLVTVPGGSVRVVRLDSRQRLQRVTSKPINIKVSGVGEFVKCQVIDKADYAYGNIPRLFNPQLVWSCESGTYIANVSHIISVVDVDKVRTSKVVPRNALHVKSDA
jgi:hypothetical protein